MQEHTKYMHILFVRILKYSPFVFLFVAAFLKNHSQSHTLNSFKLLYTRLTTTISDGISLAGQNASQRF